MIPRIERLKEKKLIGKRLSMSIANNKTFELWKSFMPRRHEIQNKLTSDLISLQHYNESFNFEIFDTNLSFEKWAAIEVTNFEHVPENMETYIIPEGLYAVFLHKGPASEGFRTFQYIFQTWLPHSDYLLDNRPHFEILGKAYKNNDPDSEEEVWIPVENKE